MTLYFHLNKPDSSSRTAFSAGTTFPFIHINTDPGRENEVIPTAHPTLNVASESINRSGFVAPVKAITPRKFSFIRCLMNFADFNIVSVPCVTIILAYGLFSKTLHIASYNSPRSSSFTSKLSFVQIVVTSNVMPKFGCDFNILVAAGSSPNSNAYPDVSFG